MAWPTSPTNNQIYTRPDGVQFQYRTASLSWIRLATGIPVTETYVDTMGANAIVIPAGARKARVQGCGGGGSGGNNNGVNWNHGSPGGGSGWGGEFLADLTSVTAISATIGAGGAGTTTAVQDGGDTTLVMAGLGTIVFGGGKGGAYTPSAPGATVANIPGADGGDPSGGLLALVTVLGSSDAGGNGAATQLGGTGTGSSGKGGSGRYGSGGRSRGSSTGLGAPAVSAGEDGSGRGAGGSGSSAQSGVIVSAKGGDGAKGFIRIEWIY